MRGGPRACAVAALALSIAIARAGEPGVPPVWYAELDDGSVVAARDADRPVNPASVIKLATTLWALEKLGARHRFATGFALRGNLDAAGRLEGDLVALGGGDPDFHVENAFLVAAALRDLGVRRVSGRLVLRPELWVGWEGGAEGRDPDPDRRARRMADRLRVALDPTAWSAETARDLRAFFARRGIDGTAPRVEVERTIVERGGEPLSPSLVHLSNPLSRLLERLNSWSNNDIERLGATLGGPEELRDFLAGRLGDAPEIRIATLSGLGSNRLAPRQIVRMLHELRASCERQGLAVEDVLPVAGCDPGTLEDYRGLGRDGHRGAVAAKTGSLTTTDGGVAALAGFAATARGTLVFCVVVPRAGGNLPRARAANERWLLERIAALGGPAGRACGPRAGFSDEDAIVEVSAPAAR